IPPRRCPPPAEIRNPKHEIPSNIEFRNRNDRNAFCVRISGFEFVSDFVLRNWEFSRRRVMFSLVRTRHRIPMIFSLSMMDVFCCTLGCVILLWLINQREAMLRTRSAQEALEQLTGARATLADTSAQRDT